MHCWRMVSHSLLRTAIRDGVGFSIAFALLALMLFGHSIATLGVLEWDRIQTFLLLLVALSVVVYSSLVIVYMICAVCCSLGWVRLGVFEHTQRELRLVRLYTISLRTALSALAVAWTKDTIGNLGHRRHLQFPLQPAPLSFLHGRSPQLE